MQKYYTFNYLKIYFWNGMAIILNIASMFIVVPMISKIPAIYGIYMLCVSISIFLAYTDLGFVGGGYKYASESYAKKDTEEEIKITGFVIFVSMVFVLIYMLIILTLSANPRIIIKATEKKENIYIASKLLFILALFSPVTIIQRFLQMVFGIRLEDFIYQMISVVCNFIKIMSVFYFFQKNKYDIVGYFFFFQLMNFLSSLISIMISKYKYNYNFILFVRSIKFSKEIFNKTKQIAFSTLYITFIWILYYELDAFVVSKLFGCEMVGFYSIGMMIMSFFRGIYGALYNPFYARFNHFIGLGDYEGLKEFYFKVIVLTMPLVVFPILSIFMLMKPFVISLVGESYLISILVGKYLILSYIYSFISSPGSTLILSLKRTKELNAISTITGIVFWLGVIFTYPFLMLMSFGIFKFVAFSVSGCFYFIISLKFLNLDILKFFKKVIAPILPPLVFLVFSLLYINQFLPLEKSKLNLLIVITIGGGISFISLCLYYLTCRDFKNYVNDLIKKVGINYGY